MPTFQIDPRTNGGKIFTVEADDYVDAATIGAQKIFRRKKIVALRQTGEPTLSGMFNAYINVDQTVQAAHGTLFHVAMI